MMHDGMSDDATRAMVERLRAKYVTTSRDDMFRGHFDRLLRRDENGAPRPVAFGATGETRGIALVDGAGGGKTTLVHRALSRHPALQSEDSGRRLWIGVRVPSPATLKSLGLEILRQSGYPEISERRERWSIWNLVRQRLQLLGTAVLWIDEAHDLFLGNARESGDILKTLKALMQGEGAVVVILTGVETLWRMTSCDDQVKRRYSKVELPALTAAQDGRSLEGLIAKYASAAGLAAPRDADLPARVIHAGRGRFGRCIETTINAIEIALLERAPALEAGHFAEAFAMAEGCAPAENVFLTPRWSQIDLAAAA